MQTSVTAATNATAPKDKAKASKSKPPKIEEPTPSPEQLDTFTKETKEAQDAQLLEQHKQQMISQKLLHQGRIAALMEQLQTQLFTIWNEVWLQRQKVHDDAFKSWMKLLVG